MAAQGIVFTVAPDPFPVFVALVARYINHDPDAGCAAHRLQHIDRSSGVRVEGFLRIIIGRPDKRLGGQMKDHLRFIMTEY